MTREQMLEILINLSDWFDEEIDEWAFDAHYGDGYAQAKEYECVGLKDDIDSIIDHLRYYE